MVAFPHWRKVGAVKCQKALDVFRVHDCDNTAINKTHVFLRCRLKNIPACAVECFINMNDTDARIGKNIIAGSCSNGAASPLRKNSNDLQKNKIADRQSYSVKLKVAGNFFGFSMQSVGLIP